MYKIIENPKNTFKVYKKGWFFWRCFQISSYAGEDDCIYGTLDEAKRAIQAVIQQTAETRVRQNFEKKVYLYSNDGSRLTR
jgi:hypothetical protein